MGAMVPVSEQAFEAMKARVNLIEREAAVRAARDEAIADRLRKIETVLSRLTWIMVSGIGGAFIAFVISGGLTHFGRSIGVAG